VQEDFATAGGTLVAMALWPAWDCMCNFHAEHLSSGSNCMLITVVSGIDALDLAGNIPGRTPSHFTFLERQDWQAMLIFCLLALEDIVLYEDAY
jgi:hypothetical protein